ncbi:MAG: polysaccharide lyase [Candidatus Hydrogenedentota bacterium]
MNAIGWTMPRMLVALGCALVLGGISTGVAHAEPLVLFESFDADDTEDLHERLERHRLLSIAEGEGVDGSTGLRADYVGFDEGSERIVVRHSLEREMAEATLSYDVKFPEEFQFVRGGKLHGLGPESPVTGGHDREPHRWSARVTFSGDDSVRTYVYDQTEDVTYGVGRSPDNGFTFSREQYHAVSMHMKLNDPDEANGFVHIYVDGDRVVSHDNLRIRGTGGEETLIQNFLFSTFHGGSGPQWAPVDEDGEYTTVHAYFDNFAVHEGEAIREAPLSQDQAAEKMDAAG